MALQESGIILFCYRLLLPSCIHNDENILMGLMGLLVEGGKVPWAQSAGEGKLRKHWGKIKWVECEDFLVA